MRTLASVAGALVAIGFAIAAAIMNWRYGLSLGRSSEDQLLFAAIAVGVDAMKMLTPFFLWWSIKSRRALPALLSAIVLLVSVSYSIVGIAGFADLNRTTTTGDLRAKHDTTAELQASLARKQAQLAALGLIEPPAVVEGKLLGLRQNARWTSSRACTDATVAASRKFCAAYAAVQADLEKGIAAGKLEAELAELRKQLNSHSSIATLDSADPRAGIVSRLMGWELLSVQTGTSILFVGIVEFCATFGVFISMSHGEFRSTARIMIE